MSVILKQLRDAKWRSVYVYAGPALNFETFACDLDGITLTHERKTPKGKVQITYRVDGRTTDSPAQAVRWLNQRRKRHGTTP